MISLLIVWITTSASLLLVSKLPIGVDIDSFTKALKASIIFGILNTLLKPILVFLTIPLTIVTLGLSLLIINAMIFGITSIFVEGFRLRYGLWSAVLGSVFLSLTNNTVLKILTVTGWN
ncbi:phage holin family protein [Candidatus Atelocyanobacterium thalassae]|uniref:Phage holin family protein n=2 Tax=Candidatus Atelocyanobacterium thalassae TaxID=713887 RepID=A0ABN6K085_9CHRO|nr:phage holin family protein [Candidatus Atelocyanobacterium thalassa]KFF41467.1 MAG: putative membrane protein [Candidatus Atelocyanobacterium thalassa isolate SIO64986]BDA40161.1 hypothetical protein CPARK_000099900 [cyanobacterium endosymbiont of Braarudosphaera bigelowii]